jgi:hypothetical protein
MIEKGDKVAQMEASVTSILEVTGANLGLHLPPSLQANTQTISQVRPRMLTCMFFFNSVFTSNPHSSILPNLKIYHKQTALDVLFNGFRVLFHEDKAMPLVRMLQN